MAVDIPPMSIYIDPSQNRPYKSIKSVEWQDIPGFSIITGRNGAGKTQLLQLLAYHFAKFAPPGPTLPAIAVAGCDYTADEIGYVPGEGLFSNAVSSSVGDMMNVRRNAIGAIQQSHNVQSVIQAAKIRRRLGLPPNAYVDNQNTEELAGRLSEDFDFAIEDLDVIKSLSHVFLAYRIKILEAIDRGTPGEDIDGNPNRPSAVASN